MKNKQLTPLVKWLVSAHQTVIPIWSNSKVDNLLKIVRHKFGDDLIHSNVHLCREL